MRSICIRALFICGVAGLALVHPAFAWTTVGDGIEYQSFTVPADPNNLFVCRMARGNTNTTIDTIVGGGTLTGGKEVISSQSSRVNDAINWWGGSWGQRNTVVCAINAEMTGATTSGGIQIGGWQARQYGAMGGFSGFGWTTGRVPFIGGCVWERPQDQFVVFQPSGTQINFDGVNPVTRSSGQFAIYTPQYAAKTPTISTGTEVLVQLPRPMVIARGADSTVGTVLQVWQNSGAHYIPFDCVIMTADGTKGTQLYSRAVIGQTVSISQYTSDYNEPDTCGANGCSYNTYLDWSFTYAAVGVNYRFVENGVVRPPDAVCHPGFIGDVNLNPRTIIAYNANYVYFVVCDGRHAGVSIGMGLEELGHWCVDNLQATDAVNLDGGGSSEMIVNGVIKNVPSDGVERAVVNGMIMVNVAPKLQSSLFSAGNTVTNNTASVNLRVGPGSNYGSITTLAQNAVGTVVAHNLNGIYAKGYYWWKCTFGSNTGWVAETYLNGATAPPPAPTDGAPVANSTSSITWNWSDVASETGYRVKDTDGVSKSGDLAANTVQWAEGSLSGNTQYTRRIYAFNAYGESGGSTGQSKYTLAKAGESTDGTGSTGNVYCTTASKSTWYGSGKTFTFSNPAGFGTGGMWKASSFEYKWSKSSTEAWSGAGTAWNSGTVSLTADQGDGDYYLHVRAFNGDSAPNNTDVLNYGPFKCDVTGPTSVTVTDEGMYTPSQDTLKASWTTSSDSASGLNRYEYAVGTSSSTQNIKGWTSNVTTTSVTITGLSLVDGTTYYVQARAVDNVENPSAGAAADGILVAPGVTPISLAWSNANNIEPLSLRNKVVTAHIGNAFWLEETNRSSAIKIVSSVSVDKGNTVSVAGVLQTDGVQRYLTGDVVINSLGNTVIQPLGVTCKWLGGGSYNTPTSGITGGQGLYNIGMLVRCWGNVTYYDTSDAQNKYFYLNDGSGLASGGHDGVKVWCGSVDPPTGGMVIVSGVISSESVGGKIVPIVMIRDGGDIVTP